MKLASVLAAVFMAPLLFTGCARLVHPREVEQLQLIQTLGYDSREGEITLSVSSGSGPAGESASLLAATGRSVTDAIRHLQAWSAREELFFAHVRFAAVGEEAAREGIEPLLDYLERSTQTPLDLPLFVVRGSTARSLVTGSADPEYEITALLSSLQRDAEQMGTVHCFSVLEVAQRLARSGTALCAAVKTAPVGPNVASAGEGALAVLQAGYAVLKDGALVGFLGPDAALGADLVLELAGQACYVLPWGETGRVTVELRREKAKLTPEWDAEGTLTAHIEVECRAGIVEADRAGMLDEAALGALSDALAAALNCQITAALEASRALDTDFLELYRRLGRASPRDFPGEEPPEFLSRLSWQVDVRAAIERSYDIDESADTGGAEARHGG